MITGLVEIYGNTIPAWKRSKSASSELLYKAMKLAENVVSDKIVEIALSKVP